MRDLLVFLFILLSINTFSQTSPYFQTEKSVVGRFYGNDSIIHGTQYSFNDYIYDYDLDTLNNTLFVQLRGVKRDKYWKDNGLACQINLQSEKLYWQKKTDFKKEYYHQFGNYIFSGDGKSSTLYHTQLGTKLWSANISFCYVNHSNQIGIGYNNNQEGDHLYGIDLLTGKEKWNSQIVREYGWDEIRYIDDSTLLIVANGLHAINIFNGKGWDINLSSGDESYGKAVAGAVGGLALGILTGTYVIPNGNATITSGLISNTLIDSCYIYIASKNRIIKVNKKDGKPVWNHAFGEVECGKSTLFFNDTLVYMIHNGSAQKEGKTIDFAKPFFAAYNRENGNEIFNTELKTRHSIIDFDFLGGDCIYLLSENEIVACSLHNGQMQTKKTYTGKTVSPFLYSIGNRFLKDDAEEGYITFNQSDTTAFFILTDEGNILKINESLEIEKTYAKQDFKYLRYAYDSLFFIDDSEKTIIFDKNTKSKIGEIDIPFLTFDGNKAFKAQKDKLTIIDLDSILKLSKTAE